MTLVTKLPESVTDSLLMPIGGFRIHRKSVGQIASFSFGGRCHCKIVGDGNFVTSGGDIIGKEIDNITVKANYTSDGDYDIVIDPKYNVVEFYLSSNSKNAFQFDLKYFNYFTSMSTFSTESQGSTGDISNLESCAALRTFAVLYSSSCYGDISVFSKNALATSISLPNSMVEGNIESLGVCSGLTRLRLQATQVVGTIENLLEGLKTSGKVSSSIAINVIGTICTYNGSVPTEELTFNFDENGDYSLALL